MKGLLKIIFLSCLIITLGSCKQKGCMDPASLNYDITAEEDDGTCIYCESIVHPIANQTQILVDNYLGSQHYLDNIVQFDFNQHSDTFNFTQCGTSGCIVDLKLTSLINETMRISYQMYAPYPWSFSMGETILLNAHATHDTKLTGSQSPDNCIPITNASITIQLQYAPTYY